MRRYIKQSLLVFSFLLSFLIKARAVNYYWVGGSGNWSDLNHWVTTSGGSVHHSQIPTAVDDVFFDNNSFSAVGQIVTFDALTVFCRNMNWTGVTNNPTLTGNAPNILKIYGSLTFVPPMTMSFAGTVSFDATTVDQTIRMGGKAFTNDINFNGIGGKWQLLDAFTTTKRISLNNGALHTNDQTVTCLQFYSPGNNIRTLDMGSSVFNVSGTNRTWVTDGNNITVNSGTSVINCNHPTAEFAAVNLAFYNLNFTNSTATATGYIFGGSTSFHDVLFAGKAYVSNGNVFNKVTFSHDAQIDGNNTYNDLILTPGHTYTLYSHSNQTTTQTITGNLVANGNCAALIDIHATTQGVQAKISHPAGSVNTSFLMLKDIAAVGGGTFTANNSIDLGNNPGWNINTAAPKDLYWVGNSGNWHDGNHWSATSGGPASGCVPTPLDNVFFNVTSFSSPGQTVTINSPFAYCKDIKWNGVANNSTLTGPATNQLKIYGSLEFVPAMNMTFNGIVSFLGSSTGKTIDMGGERFVDRVIFNGVGAEWTLLSAFTTQKMLSLDIGTLTTNNQAVSAEQFRTVTPVGFASVLNMGSSVFTITGSTACWDGIPNQFTLNAGTSTINCTSSNADFRGLNKTYYDLNFTSTNLFNTVTLVDNNVFHNVIFTPKGSLFQNTFNKLTFLNDGEMQGNNTIGELVLTAGRTYVLGSLPPNFSYTQTITGTLSATGNCGAWIDIHARTDGTRANISHPGTINVSYLLLKDIAAIGGGTFTANNSIDLGNNTGWTFNSPTGKNLYWIGNGGNWSDGNHWSLSSGGAPSGCAPSVSDNVFFDAASFSSPGQTVTLNTNAAYCRDMTWTGVTNTPNFAGTATNRLNIYGSLTFTSGMNPSFSGPVYFEATSTGKTIRMAGKSFSGAVTFNGSGGAWTLQDAFTTARRIVLNKGTLNTNNQTVNASDFWSPDVSLRSPRTLNMGSSVFNLAASLCWLASADNFTLNAGTSLINCTSPSADFRGGDLTYYDLNFSSPTTNDVIRIVGYNNFHDVVSTSKLFVESSSNFNKLTCLHDAQLNGDNVFNELYFTAGHTYTLLNGYALTVNNRWQVQGSCTSYILLQSSVPGSFATVKKPAGSVLGYNLHIKDIHCTGGANFIAYTSVDLGGNTGWNFSTLSPLANPGLVSGPSPVCPGATGVVYHLSPVQGAISYIWTVPPGATITSGQGDTAIVVNFGTAVSGNIIVQSFNGCNPGILSSIFAVVVQSPISATVTLTKSPADSVCIGQPVQFTATVSNTGNASVIYNFMVNGTSVQNSSANTFITSSLANGDTVTCSISTSGGTCNITGAASSDSIGIKTKNCGTGLCDLRDAVKLFPVPTRDKIIIDKKITACRVRINIYNAIGQLMIKDKAINDGYNEINIQRMAAGMYIAEFISGNQRVLTNKFFIQ